MGLNTTPRGYRYPDGDEPAALDIITGRLAGDIDADITKIEGRAKPLKISVLASDSGAINPETAINLGLVTFPTTKVRIVLSGVITSVEGNHAIGVYLRDGSASGTVLATLRARPPAAIGPGEVTWTALAYADVTPGQRTLYLTATRLTGTGADNLKAGFTVEVQAVNV